ncbi:hypothetical protein F5X96DRAFT_676212 [Biscogniauxia mediterranea]|nr:hypothetical protein F5X96DRAFT_676212 [Biscogniauxia mediterranea]
MASSRSEVDLEKELTCSICTDVLYQPLTLLDCLHTFCGSCLKDWFGWQKTAAETSPNPPAPGSQIYTCPSCRAPVRDTRHNATVTTLLDMFLTAHPDKAKPEDEKDEMRRKYRPGENVLPQVRLSDKSPEERRLERLERQMLDQAREMSLRDIGVDSSESSRHRRRRDHSRSEDGRSRSDRETSQDRRHRDPRERTRRTEDHRRRADSNGLLLPDSSSDDRRRYHSESQHRSRESSRTRRRHVEHQASIRSLISSSDVDSRDLEREIDAFARQIQEEGLLDGLDLDNIDLTRNDELSQKITEAYRRRQRDRSRVESGRRSAASAVSQRTEPGPSSYRLPVTEPLRPSSRQRSSSAHTRPPSATSSSDDRSRPPLSSTHLEVRANPERRRRRRTSSDGRSSTDPIRPNPADTRPAARSQTDLSTRSQSSDPGSRRPSLVDGRSASLPTGNPGATPSSENVSSRDLSFSGRASAAQNMTPFPAPDSHSDDSSNERPRRPRPSSMVVPQNPLPSLGLISSPTHHAAHSRTRSQYYPEPSITCSRCQRPHIEYELHYNCSRCAGGNWNLCISCYRSGKGCLHWFGFGHGAFTRWERVRSAGKDNLDPPHVLTANRYLPPKQLPGGAEGRKTLTTDDPMQRLESGMFCVRCFSWVNECYWRCEVCNDGDWGYCNNCVNQGYGCTHPLLPLTYAPLASPPATPSSPATSNNTPRLHRRPRTATLFTGPNTLSMGNFRPLTFRTSCDICRTAIPPTQRRYHCSSCTSSVVPDTQPGDYDVCVTCYTGLVREGRISEENGYAGWRRCLKGHRMAVVGFTEGKGAQRRYIIQDIVGGRCLHMEPYESSSSSSSEQPRLQKWWWGPDHARTEKLVTTDVADTAPPLIPSSSSPPPPPPPPKSPPRSNNSNTATATPTITTTSPLEADDNGARSGFPPDGGVGLRATAVWSWYPQPGAEDELLFPKGAEVREVEDVNGDWFFGSYMGAKGLFPAPYVRVFEQ